jgi:hypothetical protein
MIDTLVGKKRRAMNEKTVDKTATGDGEMMIIDEGRTGREETILVMLKTIGGGEEEKIRTILGHVLRNTVDIDIKIIIPITTATLVPILSIIKIDEAKEI